MDSMVCISLKDLVDMCQYTKKYWNNIRKIKDDEYIFEEHRFRNFFRRLFFLREKSFEEIKNDELRRSKRYLGSEFPCRLGCISMEISQKLEKACKFSSTGTIDVSLDDFEWLMQRPK